MSESQAVKVIEELSDKIGALENFILTNNPTLWLRWQKNRNSITEKWLVKLMKEDSE